MTVAAYHSRLSQILRLLCLPGILRAVRMPSSCLDRNGRTPGFSCILNGSTSADGCLVITRRKASTYVSRTTSLKVAARLLGKTCEFASRTTLHTVKHSVFLRSPILLLEHGGHFDDNIFWCLIHFILVHYAGGHCLERQLLVHGGLLDDRMFWYLLHFVLVRYVSGYFLEKQLLEHGGLLND